VLRLFSVPFSLFTYLSAKQAVFERNAVSFELFLLVTTERNRGRRVLYVRDINYTIL